MDAIAIIPARGGSKGLPRKNVLPLCGKPLIAWTIKSALQAMTVKRVVVSTDDAEIADISKAYGAEVVWRPDELSGDSVSSEAVLLHALRQLEVADGILAFLQCTSPLMLPEDIDGTVNRLSQADSAFTGTPWHYFVWRQTSEGVIPLGHDKAHRPLRQQMRADYLEVGAVYALRVAMFLKTGRRFVGRTAIHPIPPERAIEIDDHTDFLIAETLLRQRLLSDRARQLPTTVQALIMDFDGVLTDNRVAVAETGAESVACHRGDGWAMRRLLESGMRLLILTSESNPVVKHRCAKLGVECMVTTDKLSALKRWLADHDVSRKSAVYVGNDAPDAPCMLHVGCGVAPADAYPIAKQAAQIILDTPGGHGCIRELAGLLLHELTSEQHRSVD